MKTIYLSAIAVVLSLSSVLAQEAGPGPGTVTVISEDGENFTLYLNEDKKNGSPASRVVANITEVPISFRIVFDGGIPEIKKRGIRQGTHCMFAIQKNKKTGERSLKVRGCNEEAAVADNGSVSTQNNAPTTAPAQLSATYANGVITINDGRTLTVKKVQANGMTYPRVIMTNPSGAHASISYDDNTEKYNAEIPFQYEVKDFSNNNSYLTLTVDEGGPEKTWHVKLQNSNGYDLKID